MQHTHQQLIDELERRQQSLDSLLSFTEYTHPEWQTGEHHKVICEHLEAVERGEISRLIITIDLPNIGYILEKNNCF